MNRIGTDLPSRDCLIAVVNNDRDLERFARDGCYRIPGRAIGHAISPRTLEESRVLALYQTSSVSAGLRGAVELWGEIVEMTWSTRRELIPEEPDHPAADEPYRLIRVASVEHLERPVASPRPRRITFIRTTRERLFGAADLNDLFVGSEAEESLWRALGGLDVERRYLMTVRETVMEVDFAIFREDRAIGVICGDGTIGEPGREESLPDAWLLIRFSQADLMENLKECIARITSLLEGPISGIGTIEHG